MDPTAGLSHLSRVSGLFWQWLGHWIKAHESNMLRFLHAPQWVSPAPPHQHQANYRSRLWTMYVSCASHIKAKTSFLYVYIEHIEFESLSSVSFTTLGIASTTFPTGNLTVKTWQIFVHVIEMCDCCSKCIRLLANTIVSQQADAIVPFLQWIEDLCHYTMDNETQRESMSSKTTH